MQIAGLADLSIHCHQKRIAGLGPARAVDNVGKATGKLLDLLPKFDVGPASLEKKDRVPRSFPRFDFVRIAADRDISGKDHPAGLIRELFHPVRVRSVLAETVA